MQGSLRRPDLSTREASDGACALVVIRAKYSINAGQMYGGEGARVIRGGRSVERRGRRGSGECFGRSVCSVAVEARHSISARQKHERGRGRNIARKLNSTPGGGATCRRIAKPDGEEPQRPVATRRNVQTAFVRAGSSGSLMWSQITFGWDSTPQTVAVFKHAFANANSDDGQTRRRDLGPVWIEETQSGREQGSHVTRAGAYRALEGEGEERIDESMSGVEQSEKKKAYHVRIIVLVNYPRKSAVVHTQEVGAG
ncbi:hypothetical protein B0H16DRAFT_1767441 [Mycena metata]|uniref:Uncharacterized protein n=1 Tax=Mycena metata TaxID=1033252 RepID=A0AAD7MVA2_9AGAR|nr:hypothetical protein B0H16DRAFT_1767441 [Mycena metata]